MREKRSSFLLGYLAELGGYLLFRDETEVMIEATEQMTAEERC